MRNVFRKLAGSVADRVSSDAAIREPAPINLSNYDCEWNKSALENAWKPGNGILPRTGTRSPSEIVARQQRTCEYNRLVIEYARMQD